MAENNEPPAPDANAGRQAVNLPRRHIPTDRQPPAQPPANQINDHLATIVDSMMVLANHLGTEQTSPPELANDRSGRRVKKFQRSGAGEERPASLPETGEGTASKDPAEAPAPGDAAKRDAAAFNRNVAWPRQAGLDPAGESAPPPARPKRKRPNKRVVALTVQVGGLCLIALGFLAGRMSLAPVAGTAGAGQENIRSKSPDGGGTVKVDDPLLQIANEAMRRTAAGDLDGARGVYEDVLKKHLDLPGVRYQLGRLALRRDDFLDADLNFDRSTAAGEYLTPILYTRARMVGMKGNYADVVRLFQAAVHTEPFNARYFFYLGEALRRRGQTKSAVEAFGQALERAHTMEEGRLYLLKQGYAKIETDDAPFNAELNERLKAADATADVWFFAAARHVTRSEFPAAADALKKASALLSPPAFALQVKDYLFQACKDEPAFAGLLKTPPIQDSTEFNGPFLDPSVLPIELADPAIWPVALAAAHKGM